MDITILILTGLGILLLLFGMFHKAGTGTTILIGIIILLIAAYVANKKEIVTVDLPEEISQISNDSNKPDTLLGYKDKDTYYILYPNKHR